MPPKKPANAKRKPIRQAGSKAEDETETKHVAKQQSVPEDPQGAASETKKQNGRVPETQDEQTLDSPSKKRKRATEPDQPQKATRRSTRGAPKSQPSEEQVLRYLLSKDAESLCRPEDETEDIRQRGELRTYSSSVLTPFEELLCAVILSRPISHRLGMRSIRTVLNGPYDFTTPQAIKAAGAEKRHQALWDAKTQHKGKTADQIGEVADIVLEKFTSSDDDGTHLRKALESGNHDIDKTLDLLRENVKGLGKTGLDIFRRRVQWVWDVGYPFIDDRTSKSLVKMGLPDDAHSLENLIGKYWNQLSTANLAGENDKAKKRRAFVVILERAVGADLEGKVDALSTAAAGVS